MPRGEAPKKKPERGLLDRGYPSMMANIRAAEADAADAYRRGQIAEALGASARKVVTAPAGLVGDLVHSLVGEGGFERGAGAGTGRAFKGIVGDLNWTDGKLPVAAKKVVAPAVAAAAAAPREDTIATPFRNWLADLGPAAGKLSLNDLASLSGSFNNMIPASAKATTKPDEKAGNLILSMVAADRDAAVARAQKAGDAQAELDADSVAMQRIAQFFGKGLGTLGLEERE